MASHPPSTEVGLFQLVTTLPVAMPGGTRPEATAPTIAPRKYGVTTDDSANDAPRNRCIRGVVMVLRKANAPPRTTIPKPASVNGMYSVEATAAKAVGKPVHSTTSTKISQTWFASHTGPTECSINVRCGRPLTVPPA